DMLGLPIENVSVKLGDSTLPQSPVEGGSWIAASVSHAIIAVAEEVRAELLRAAKQMEGSPLAGAGPDDVVLANGRIVSSKDSSRAVSIADAMHAGTIDRIEKEKTHSFRNTPGYARNT